MVSPSGENDFHVCLYYVNTGTEEAAVNDCLVYAADVSFAEGSTSVFFPGGLNSASRDADVIALFGDSMDEAIIGLFRQKHALLIGESTAENVKIQIGSVLPLKEELEMEVKGRDLADGLPKVTRVSSVEVREVLMPIVSRIEDMVKVALEQTPPELSRDIVDNGIVLTGGGSQLRGLAPKLTKVLNAPVILSEDPIHAVANGVGLTLQNLGEMKRILTTVHKSQL